MCVKMAYPNKSEAKKHLRHIAKIRQKAKKPIRAYKCPACAGWHLTSMTIEEFKAGGEDD